MRPGYLLTLPPIVATRDDQQPDPTQLPTYQTYLTYLTYQAYLHTKLRSSSVLPLPLYTAFCGYGHSGRLRVTAPFASLRAITRSGALPCSTQSTIALFQSAASGPAPPPQCRTPGIRNVLK